VRREYELDRQREQRPQPFGDLLPGSAVLQYLWWDLGAATEVDQRIAGDDGTTTLDLEHEVVVRPPRKRLDPDRKQVARRVQVGLAAVPGQEPGDVRAVPALRDLLGTDAVLVDEVVCGVGRRREHRHAEALDQGLWVARW
jgi:hypothetical protein